MSFGEIDFAGAWTKAGVTRVVEENTCAGCVKLRAELVEALNGVDTTDWDSMEGSRPRSLASVLRDMASRLEALGCAR